MLHNFEKITHDLIKLHRSILQKNKQDRIPLHYLVFSNSEASFRVGALAAITSSETAQELISSCCRMQ